MKRFVPVLAAAVGLGVLGFGPMVQAAENYATVKITLWDKGADIEPPTDLGIGMGGDMSKATMGMHAEPKSVQAGDVTLEVTNASKDTIHEMVVVPITSESEPLPFNPDENAVDEDAASAIGEVPELDPGASGSVTLRLAAGTYALICNVAGHYGAGMWTILTVSP